MRGTRRRGEARTSTTSTVCRTARPSTEPTTGTGDALQSETGPIGPVARKRRCGAEGGTRTPTGLRPPPPQDGVRLSRFLRKRERARLIGAARYCVRDGRDASARNAPFQPGPPPILTPVNAPVFPALTYSDFGPAPVATGAVSR